MTALSQTGKVCDLGKFLATTGALIGWPTLTCKHLLTYVGTLLLSAEDSTREA